MKKLGRDCLYWAIIALVYYIGYGLTFVIPYSDMGTLLFYFPLWLIIISFTYGCLRGMSWWYAPMVGLLYLPVVAHSYLATNARGMEVYVGIYAVLALLAQGLGSLVRHIYRKTRKQNENPYD